MTEFEKFAQGADIMIHSCGTQKKCAEPVQSMTADQALKEFNVQKTTTHKTSLLNRGKNASRD
ncbi:MAG: hypothetical protein ACI4QM_03520 [Alphaproteobacteria bacterium]